MILVQKKGETLAVTSVGFLVALKGFPTTSNLNKKFHGFFMFVIEERKRFITDKKNDYYKQKKRTIMESPKHLKHHPIVSVNDYDQIDGQYYNQDTDVRALSIGEATWDNEHISLKVWRRPNERWSRQSEELPIHRCLDLSILFLACLKKDKNLPYPTCSLPLTIDDKIKFDTIRSFYENASNKKHIDARLNELRNLLNEWFEREGGNNGK